MWIPTCPVITPDPVYFSGICVRTSSGTLSAHNYCRLIFRHNMYVCLHIWKTKLILILWCMWKGVAGTNSNTCTYTGVWLLRAQSGMYDTSENCHPPCTFCMDLCNWKHPLCVTCWLYTGCSVVKQLTVHSKLSWYSPHTNVFLGGTYRDRE